ncbi:MAG: LysR family transcriptional regulator [Lachnospiraceae bacterium]|nr:LysR family transcriptional regulator [Lachnospiraceae bacterium]
MTIQQLEYLVTIAQSASISQAAQKLFISQSSISKSVKQLENELGFELMNRSHKGVVFTPKGEEFLREAYSLTERYRAMLEHYVLSESDTIRYTVSSQHYIFVVEALSHLISELDDNYSVGLLEHRTSQIIQDVTTRTSRLGFIYYYPFNKQFIHRELERNDLSFHPFCTAQPHIYVSTDHPLAQLPKVTQDQLVPYPYVCYSLGPDAVEFAEEILSPLHHSKIINVVDRDSLFRILSRSKAFSLGSGLLRDGFVCEKIATVPISLPVDTTMTIGWIAPKGQTLSPTCIQFLDYCKQSLQQCYTGNPLIEKKPFPI